MVNSWLAGDLGVQAGDSLTLSYFKVGPLRQLSEEEASFRVKAIVPLEGRFADATLMPDLPGLSDAGNCRDWDTGVPISLESIRDKDEEYWDTYGGTPKAFIALGRAQELWSNRFGALTAHDFAEVNRAALEEEIRDELDPMALGYSLESALVKGEAAAREGVDFSQLFLGLSFFLLLAGIMLIVLLFRLNLESRLDERKTLRSLGLPEAKIRQILLFESLGVALLASLAGLLLAVLYNKGVFVALNGVWKDVVRTPMMFTRVSPLTLLTGGLLTLVVAFLAFWFPLRKRGRSSSKLRRDSSTYQAPRGRMRLWAAVALSSVVLSLVLVAGTLAGGGSMQVGLFFGAGGLLLLGALSGTAWFLERRSRSAESFGLETLAWKNAVRNRTRSMSIVILFAIGAFLVISTGSNRKDLHQGASSPESGSGGFLYYAESTLPVLQRLDDGEVRYQYSLSGGYSIVQLRRAEGDDASCLNLNKVVSPRILGVDPSRLEGRFSFVTRSPYLDEAHPWASLEQELEGGLVPAIADETVIKWGLGMSVGDTLHYVNAEGQALDLLLIGGLAPSVFQGSVLIAEEAFIKHYPASSGTQVFLVDAPPSADDTALIGSELSRGLRDLGWEMELSADRLARFYSVTNAYLSIFMVMGGLGLLLGTFGLVVVLWRSMLERREELAMFRAMGYPRARIRRLLTREYLYLLYLGIAFGFLSAILATLPSVLSPHTQTSLTGILIWLGVLLLNGLIWIRALTAVGLRSGSIIQSLRNE